MSENPSLNSVSIADFFTKEQKFNDYPADEYPCENMEEISLYVMSLNSDKRAIATGADSTNYSIFQTLKAPAQARKFARAVGIFVDSMINLLEPNSILINQSLINNYIMPMSHRSIGASITIMNAPYLHIYEKFSKSNPALAQIPYDSITKYEILGGVDKEFEMIIVFADDIEGELDYLSAMLDMLPVGGVMLIANSANQGVLYRTSEFDATPQAELHEFVNNDNRFISYHIPLLVGFSIIKKIN